MDELDLVRLSRPSTVESDDERIATIKARALPAMATNHQRVGQLDVGVISAADDAAVVELASSLMPRRRPRARVVAIAATIVLLVVGGVALSRRHPSDGGTSPINGAAADSSPASVSAVPTLAQLDGETFDIAALTVGTEDRTLVTTAGRPLTIRINGSVVRVDTGCNNGGGDAARIENGHLVIKEWSTTLVACGGALRAQEDAMRALLTSKPAISLRDDELTLAAASSTLLARRHSPDSPTTSLSATTIGPVQPASPPPPTTVPIDPGAPLTVPTMAQLEGHRFDIVRLVVDGSDRAIVSGITGRLPSVGVTGGVLNVDGGCNGTGATASVDDGRLHVRLDEYGIRTNMACSPEATAQENALDAIVLATPLISLHGSVLTFTADRSLIEARLRADKPLVGTPWRTNGRVLPDNRGIGFGGLDGTLTLGADGTWTYSGCTYEQGRYALEGATLVLTRDPTSSATVVNSSCTRPIAEDEQLTMGPIFDQPLTWSVATDALTLRASNGAGAQFRYTPS